MRLEPATRAAPYLALGAIFALLGCVGSRSPADEIAGSWTGNGYLQLAYTFNTDGTYATQAVKPISATAGQAQVETGRYAVSGSQIDWTPQASTCPGPDPGYSLSFTLKGDDLTMLALDETTPVSFVRATGSSDGGNSALVLGCFQAGSFVQTPLGPVGN